MHEQGCLTQQPTVKGTCSLSPHTLRQVLDYIQENLSRPLTQAEIAAVVHISPYHFARLFRRATGQSPHQYIIAQRVEKAAQLLLTQQFTMTEIALQVGFVDQSHFYRHFKRHWAVTPKQFVEARTNVQGQRTNIQES